jgi:hypothetical protein
VGVTLEQPPRISKILDRQEGTTTGKVFFNPRERVDPQQSLPPLCFNLGVLPEKVNSPVDTLQQQIRTVRPFVVPVTEHTALQNGDTGNGRNLQGQAFVRDQSGMTRKHLLAVVCTLQGT